VVGAGTMMPGLEAALLGMHGGEEKTFDVAPAEAYGEVDPRAIRAIPRTTLPADLKPEVGMAMEVRSSGEQTAKALVKAVEGDRILLDFNHPLAGKTLTFKVKLLSIGAAKAAEAPYPHALAAPRTYPDLLKVTSAGVVYASRLRKNTDPGVVAGLFEQLKKDADNALLQCGMQIVGVEVTGDIVKTYGVLNTPTRATLLKLVDRSTGTVTEEKVMSGLLARYAEPDERNRKGLICELLLKPLTDRNESLNKQLKGGVCPHIGRLTACLDDLRAADQRVGRQAGAQSLRLYSGDRWDSDRNYLDQFETTGR
ncbi:MAG: peptidylprolyl isomerase, partial [Gallionellaceae bacterium]|nr:peptidylprolyl isomerase [Gallionellaceae bacterium]